MTITEINIRMNMLDIPAMAGIPNYRNKSTVLNSTQITVQIVGMLPLCWLLIHMHTIKDRIHPEGTMNMQAIIQKIS